MDDVVETVNLSSQMEKTFFQHLNELRLGNLFCDVRFNVNGTIMPCHRLVLATVSPYFKTMFNGNFKESNSDVITMNDIETEAFEEILNAVYTASIHFSPSNAFFILKASHLLQLNVIENACSSYIVENPKILYLIDTCVFAKSIQQMELYFTCMMTIEAELFEYGKTDSFKRIPIDILENILRENAYPCQHEESILLLIMKWGKENNASHQDIQKLLNSANLRVTRYVNSSLMTQLLITCDETRIDETRKTSQKSDTSSSLTLKLYLNAIDVKTGQQGWTVLKMNDTMDEYVVSSFNPSRSCYKKVCTVGSKLYCLEYFKYLGKKNVFSYYDEQNVRIFLPAPDLRISAFDMFALDNSIYVVTKKHHFIVWVYDIEENTWINVVKKCDNEKVFCNVSACTFSKDVFYIIAERYKENPPARSMNLNSGKYIFSFTCRSSVISRLTKVPCSNFQFSSICAFDRKIAVFGSGTWLYGDAHTFMIFDIDAKQWSKDLKMMKGRHETFNLFHCNGFLYVVDNGRAMVANEKYGLRLDEWTDLPSLPQQLTLADTDDVVATGKVFDVEVGL